MDAMSWRVARSRPSLVLRHPIVYPAFRALYTGLSAFVREVKTGTGLRVSLTLCCMAITLLLAGVATAASGNLLAELRPLRSEGVKNTGRLSDGVRAHDGDSWNTELTAVFDSPRSFVVYDLGSVVPVDAAFLQGDNNDEYLLSVSDDGQRFREIWAAPAVQSPGLQQRSARRLGGSGRYVRVSARGGDGAYSLSELQVFSQAAGAFPPKMEVRGGVSGGVRVQDAIILFVLGFVLFLAACTRTMSQGRVLLLGLVPLVAGFLLWQTVQQYWPVSEREVALLRAACAAIAGAALLREAAFRRRFPAHPAAVLAALSVSAVLAFGCFYNLGRFQFSNHAESRREFVHTWDMRVYYPFAKYFEELGYDGVYLASVAAYVETVPGTTLESIGDTEIRNMKTHRMQHVEDVAADIRAISGRFTPERWRQFKQDMGYFRNVMGPSYLTTHHDHGSNATPVWVAFAKLLFSGRPATEGVLVFGGLIDLGLLLALFAAMWRSFGVRLALLAMVVFGANDYYMLGSNWAGATLRHDWLVYLGFGVCALRVQRWWLAGVFLGLSTMIRAFPGAALIGVALPAAMWFAETWYRSGKPPHPRDLLAQHGAAARVLAGAAACMLLTFLGTGLLFSFASWSEWWQKVNLLNSQMALNSVSLKALMGTDGRGIALGVQAWQLSYRALFAVCLAVIVIACRRRRLHDAALLALPLIAVVTNPANYYIHFILLLPLLGGSKDEPDSVAEASAADGASRPLGLPALSVAGPLLAICVAQYWTTFMPDLGQHFQAASGLLFAGFAWMYVRILQRDEKAERTSRRQQAASASSPAVT